MVLFRTLIITFFLEGLKKTYGNVKLIHLSILSRLRLIAEKDSTLNAIIILNLFAERILVGIEDCLEGIRRLFSPYLTAVDRDHFQQNKSGIRFFENAGRE